MTNIIKQIVPSWPGGKGSSITAGPTKLGELKLS